MSFKASDPIPLMLNSTVASISTSVVLLDTVNRATLVVNVTEAQVR
jgi:hypothetical protein